MRLTASGRRKLLKAMLIDNISQRQLARDIGYRSHSYLQRILRGDPYGVSRPFAERIADRVGVPISDLFLPESSENSDDPSGKSNRGVA